MPNKAKKSRKGRGKNAKPDSTHIKPLQVYTQPAARIRVLRPSQPRVKFQADRCTIAHRELVTSVTGVSAWAGNVWYRINPQNSDLFPWLANIAQCWERYRFKRLTFHFEPTCATSVNGAVQMAVDTDPQDPTPANEQLFAAWKGFVEVPAWKSGRTTYTANDLHADVPYKVNSPGFAVDQRLTDVGYFYIAAFGDTVRYGKLFVEYDVEFKTQHLANITGPSVTITDGDTGVTSLMPFGTNPSIVAKQIGVTVDTATNNTVTLTSLSKDTYYQILYDVLSNSNSTSVAASLVTSGLQLIQAFHNTASLPPSGYKDICGGIFKALSSTATFYLPSTAVPVAHAAAYITSLGSGLTSHASF